MNLLVVFNHCTKLLQAILNKHCAQKKLRALGEPARKKHIHWFCMGCFEATPPAPQPQHMRPSFRWVPFKRPSFRRVPFKRSYFRRVCFSVCVYNAPPPPLQELREHRLRVPGILKQGLVILSSLFGSRPRVRRSRISACCPRGRRLGRNVNFVFTGAPGRGR